MGLLTGVTGYIGRQVLERLLAEGMGVRALVRRADASVPAEVELAVLDLAHADESLDAAMAAVDVVVHCAAHLGPGNREHHRIANVEITRRLLDAAARARVRRFVHVSTVAVYGWKRPGSLIGPDDPYEPCPDLRDDYAWSKIAADRWVRLYRDRGLLDAVSVRPGIVYGGGRDFVARVWRRLRGPLCAIGGGGNDVLPLVHLRDTAEAIWRAASCLRGTRSPVNVVGPDAPTQSEYLRLRARQLGEEIRPIWIPFQLLRPWTRWLAARSQESVPQSGSLFYSLTWSAQAVRFDLEATRRDLGWAPDITPAETLNELRNSAVTNS